MAKIRKNIVIQGLSGSLGDQLVIRHDKAGRTIIAVAPTYDEDRTFTEAQTAQHERFREAAAYAKDAKETEEYVAKAEGTPQTSYNVAMADWFHAPEVEEIDASAWSGEANEVIRIRATDNVKVTQVTVLLTDGDGTVLEQGNAVESDGSWWTYTTQASTPGASRIVASARDLPGNIAQLEWED
jgi:hypothetical protein